ncbi:MAG: PrgI family protein [Oscillospiraceae bacterium]
MIRVKVTKNIIRNGTIAFGLTLKQILSAVIAVAIALLSIFLLKDKMNFDLLMTLVFVEIIIVILLGVVQLQGMSFAKFVLLSFKGTDKRPFCIKGVFKNEKTKK